MVVADPVTLEEATGKKDWMCAMEEEMASIQETQTWELIDPTVGVKIVGLNWVCKTKYNPDGSLHKHKALLVAKGYSQVQGVDHEDAFSPVVRLEMVRGSARVVRVST